MVTIAGTNLAGAQTVNISELTTSYKPDIPTDVRPTTGTVLD